jgi:uncharacterized iron-regulated membrane protein
MSAVSAPALYATIWRWHFIAGLLVLPFLLLLAVTGGVYLFKPELDHWMYRAMAEVPARDAGFAPMARVIAQVEGTMKGRVLQFTPSNAPTRSVRLLVRDSRGAPLTVYADPYDGHVTGSTAYGGVMQVIRKIHSLQLFGFWASCLIELAAGWSIVLVGTGVYLWWPRGRAAAGGVVSVRGAPRQRVFWRDVHAVTGVFAATVIAFLALTGMPWSMFWGAHVQDWATARHLNAPTPPAKVTPEWMMTTTMPNMPSTMPWAMEHASMPDSAPPASAAPAPLDADQALARFAALGVAADAGITLPEGPKGAWVATSRPDRVEETRVVYLDQYTGAILGDVGFKDWGPVGKAIEWGIAVHQGQQYGAFNRYLMLAGCIALTLMCLAAVVMWWKRRPAGSIGVPPAPRAATPLRGLVMIVATMGTLFPLVGVSLLIAFGISRVARR